MTRLVLLAPLAGLLFTLHVSRAIAEELTANDYIEFLKPFVGSWTVTHGDKVEVAESILRVRLARSGTSFITTVTGVGRPGAIQVIEGYDPVAKKWTMVGFSADGALVMHRITFPAIQKGQHFSGGQLETRDITVNQPDGTVVTVTSKGVWLEVSEDRMVFVPSDSLSAAGQYAQRDG